MSTYLSIDLLSIAFDWFKTPHGFDLLGPHERPSRGWDAELQTQETITGLLPDDVEKFPSYNYNTGCGEETGSGTAICTVCLESLCIGDKCRLLPQYKHSSMPIAWIHGWWCMRSVQYAAAVLRLLRRTRHFPRDGRLWLGFQKVL